MKKIRLYTKRGCTLCDKVKARLETMQSRYPHELEEVDIEHDQLLFNEYRFLIPVLVCGEKIIKAPISDNDLRNLFGMT